MLLNENTVTLVNTIFCFVVFIVGMVFWGRTKYKAELYIGLAFGIFGLTHLAIVLGLEINLLLRIVARILAYLLVIYGLYQATRKK